MLETIFYLAVGLRTFLQILDANSEYSARSFIVKYAGKEWWIHSDEKTILPDARNLFLRKKIGSVLTDYGPWPVSAAFGIGCTILNFAGFCLLGLNPRGFRTPYIIVAALADLTAVMLFHHALPPSIAWFPSFLLIFNYRQFLSSRHAYPEHILTLALAAVALLFSMQMEIPQGSLELLFLGLSPLIWVKPNLLIYSYMLAFLAALLSGISVQRIFHAGCVGVAGIVALELVQALALHMSDSLKWRYRNLSLVFKQHTGRKDSRFLIVCPPPKWKVLPEFVSMLSEWFEVPPRIAPYLTSALLFLAPFPTLILYFKERQCCGIFFALFLFHAGFLAMSAFMFFYLKRVFSIFSLTLCMFSLSLASLAKLLSLPLFWGMQVLMAAFCALFAIRQLKRLACLCRRRKPSLWEEARKLEKLLPKGETVFAHCFAYRYFWQARTLRIKSCDDQTMDNQRILDWAIKENGKYVILSNRGGRTREDVPLKPLSYFHSSGMETDYVESYALFKIEAAVD